LDTIGLLDAKPIFTHNFCYIQLSVRVDCLAPMPGEGKSKSARWLAHVIFAAKLIEHTYSPKPQIDVLCASSGTRRFLDCACALILHCNSLRAGMHSVWSNLARSFNKLAKTRDACH
jgi:hypothetical protein